MMAIKSSNVVAKVEPKIKEQAESIPVAKPVALDEMTKEEFDAKMARGLSQAKADEGVPADEFFSSLRQEILQSYV